MQSRLVLSFLLISTMLLCSGCFGARETEDVAYVLTIGFDKAVDGQEIITYQIAVPRGGGGEDSMGGKGEEAGSWITNTIAASNSSEARMLLKTTMSRYPNISHISAIILGEKVAREGIGDLLSYFMRNRDYRETILVAVVEGTAEDYIRRNKPKLEKNVAKYYETFFQDRESGYYIRSDLHDFYTALKSGGVSPVAVYGANNAKHGENQPAAPPSPRQGAEPYLAGGIPRAGTESPTEFAGLAVFRGDKMAGVLDSEETRAVNLLRGESVRAYVGVVDPLDPKYFVNMSVRLGAKPKIKGELRDNGPIFTVNVFIEAEIMGIPSGINYERGENRVVLEQQLSALFTEQMLRMIEHTQQLGCDPVGFGMYLRPKFADYNAVKQADFAALYQASEIHVNVNSKIRRTGLDWQTTQNAAKPGEAE